MPLPLPTLQSVREAARTFATDAYAHHSAEAVRLAFSQWPRNSNLTEVLAKVVILNRLYSTNVYNIYGVAEHIVQLQIDQRLKNLDLSLVDEIADVPGTKHYYSFATKFCFAHQPDAYPVFDSQVERALWEYRKADAFAEFRVEDLRRYGTFVPILQQFRSHYRVQAASLQELDRFLWTAGQQTGT
jgi:hypothetical protein